MIVVAVVIVVVAAAVVAAVVRVVRLLVLGDSFSPGEFLLSFDCKKKSRFDSFGLTFV